MAASENIPGGAKDDVSAELAQRAGLKEQLTEWLRQKFPRFSGFAARQWDKIKLSPDTPSVIVTALPLVQKFRLARAREAIAAIPEGEQLLAAAEASHAGAKVLPGLKGPYGFLATRPALALDGNFAVVPGVIGLPGVATGDQLAAAYLRELVKLRQAQSGVADLRTGGVYSPDDTLRQSRFVAADAEATTVELAWKLKGAGRPEAWQGLGGLSGGSTDIRAAYEAAALDPAAVADGSARRAAFDAWFTAGPDDNKNLLLQNLFTRRGLDNWDETTARAMAQRGAPARSLSREDVLKLGSASDVTGAGVNYLALPGGRSFDDAFYDPPSGKDAYLDGLLAGKRDGFSRLSVAAPVPLVALAPPTPVTDTPLAAAIKAEIEAFRVLGKPVKVPRQHGPGEMETTEITSRYQDLSGATRTHVARIPDPAFSRPPAELESTTGLKGIAGDYRLPDGLRPGQLDAWQAVLNERLLSGELAPDKAKEKIRELCGALEQLNPALRQPGFERQKPENAWAIVWGVAHGYSPADIRHQLSAAAQQRVSADSAYGRQAAFVAGRLGGAAFQWQPSPETLLSINAQLDADPAAGRRRNQPLSPPSKPRPAGFLRSAWKAAKLAKTDPLALLDARAAQDLRVERALDELSAVPEGKALADLARKNRTKFDLDVTRTGYDATGRFHESPVFSGGVIERLPAAVKASGRIPQAALVAVIAHELEHARQAQANLDILDGKIPSPQESLWHNAFIEADANATAVDIAWKLKQAGKPDVWREITSGAGADAWTGPLAGAYEAEVLKDPAAAADGRAKRAAFDGWFSMTGDGRDTFQDVYAAQGVGRWNAGTARYLAEHGAPFAPLETGDLKKIGDLSGVNYLAIDGGRALDDDYYRDVRLTPENLAALETQNARYDSLRAAFGGKASPFDGNAAPAAGAGAGPQSSDWPLMRQDVESTIEDFRRLGKSVKISASGNAGGITGGTAMTEIVTKFPAPPGRLSPLSPLLARTEAVTLRLPDPNFVQAPAAYEVQNNLSGISTRFVLPDGLQPAQLNSFIEVLAHREARGDIEPVSRVTWQRQAFNELARLNPELGQLDFDHNNVKTMHDVLAGVARGFNRSDLAVVAAVATGEAPRPAGADLPWSPSVQTLALIRQQQEAQTAQAPPPALSMAPTGGAATGSSSRPGRPGLV